MLSPHKSIHTTSRVPRTPRPVLVIGEALVDRFVDGEVVGGAPFNVARSLAAFGVPTTFISRIGDDDDDGARVLASALRFVGLAAVQAGAAVSRALTRTSQA